MSKSRYAFDSKLVCLRPTGNDKVQGGSGFDSLEEGDKA